MSDIPEGYRQTEVGVIPEEWEVKTLGEIFKFLSTGNNSRSDLSEYGEIKNIHYGDIHTKWKYFLDCSKDIIPSINKDKVKNLPLLEDGDLVMADASEDYEGLGVSVEIKNIKNEKVVAGLHTLLLRGDKTKVADGFKGYIQSIKVVRNSLNRIATGISVYGISKNNLKSIQIPLPPLPEQQAIASALSDVDALITALEQLITKKRNIKQGAMQQLLTGKKRLPGFGGEWEVKTLENVCAKNGLVRGPFGGTLKKEFFVRNGFKVYEQKNAIYRNVDLGNYFIDNNKFNELKRFEVKNGDFIVSCSGTIGKIYQIPEGAECGIINQALLKIKTDNNIIHDRFFFYYFDWEKFQEKIIDNTQGGAMQNLVGMNIFRNTQILLPPLPEQQAIAQILSDMDTEIEAMEQKRDKYRALKQGMMQELLTGKTRLLCQQ